jgi:hypothetical protein
MQMAAGTATTGAKAPASLVLYAALKRRSCPGVRAGEAKGSRFLTS